MNKAKRFFAAALALPARASVAFHTAPDRLNDRANKLQVNALACFAVVGAMLLSASPAAAQSSGGGGDITSSMRTLATVVFGCMLVFAAAWIVDQITGG